MEGMACRIKDPLLSVIEGMARFHLIPYEQWWTCGRHGKINDPTMTILVKWQRYAMKWVSNG